MQSLCTLFILAVAFLSVPASTQNPPLTSPAAKLAATAPPRTSAPPFQVGMASWYGKWFQGKETTSGEPFNMFAMTAAHKFLPFGTRVRVTNLLNRRSVVLRINDRGPVPAGRIIDLSYAAARALHFYEDGLVPVRVDILPQVAQVHLPSLPGLPAR